MSKKELIAMILAGGQGSRLGVLTKSIAKPAVPFGGKYRIIDFTLSNCINSDIYTVGVLTQYQPLKLNSHIGIGSSWDLNRRSGGVTILPPYIKGRRGDWYKGTADAIYQNIHYIEQFNPEYVLILSGDHIYKMDYAKMLQYHKEKEADATIAVIKVPWEDASRFGIMNTRKDGSIEQFEEKPLFPKNNLASMGIYVFNWSTLMQFLHEDSSNPNSSHDFGKNIIPKMLGAGKRMCAYSFQGYWRDVGTIHSLWEANMNLLEYEPKLVLNDPLWGIYSQNPGLPPQYISPLSSVNNSILSEGCIICGSIDHSVVSPGVYVGKGSLIKDSVVMPGARIGDNVTVHKSIIGGGATIESDSIIGYGEDTPNQYQPDIYNSGLTVIGENVFIDKNTRIGKNVVVDMSLEGIQVVESGECITKVVMAG